MSPAVARRPLDFERWQAESVKEWSYADVSPYVRKAKTRAEGGDRTCDPQRPLCCLSASPDIG
jgi:choline dehydrogenase